MSDEGDLFAHARRGTFEPLAERMRPQALEEVVGQPHLVGPTGLLVRLGNARRIPSLIFWGPPGTGKTTLAKLLAGRHDAAFELISATGAGVKDLRAAVERARRLQNEYGRKTVLFIDEIHRFNKAQQDALLPHVEAGVCTLLGATTENPSFSVNAALLSRARVVVLRPLDFESLTTLLQRALAEPRGLGERGLEVDVRVLRGLARFCDGDARRALNTLELAADLVAPPRTEITPEDISMALGRRDIRYDRDGEEHYNVASALIKSMRASDPDAAVYWLARMLEAGEDPMFAARRLVIFASEDVGNADPQALCVAQAAAQAVHLIGLPEAVLPLTQAASYLALAPKSNAVIAAYFAARKDVREHGSLAVPMEIRNAPTSLMKNMGYGQGYRYPHQFEEGLDPGHVSHLPQELRDALPGRRYLKSSRFGWEAEAEAELQARRATSEPPASRGEDEDPP